MIGIIILGVVIAILFKDSDMMQSFMESQKAAFEAQQTIKDSIN